MSPDLSDDRTWVPVLADQRLGLTRSNRRCRRSRSGSDPWRFADLPRQHAQTIEGLVFSILDLDEEVFIADDYDAEADEDDSMSTYRVPWWLAALG